MVEYKLLTFNEALSLNLVDEQDRYYNEYNYFVVKFETNKNPILIAQDGGEPEDQLLVRNWKWVVPELNKTYQAGYGQGYKDSAHVATKIYKGLY